MLVAVTVGTHETLCSFVWTEHDVGFVLSCFFCLLCANFINGRTARCAHLWFVRHLISLLSNHKHHCLLDWPRALAHNFQERKLARELFDIATRLFGAVWPFFVNWHSDLIASHRIFTDHANALVF